MSRLEQADVFTVQQVAVVPGGQPQINEAHM